METLQDGSHDWSVAMKGYSLIKKDRKGIQGGIVAPYVRGQLERREALSRISRVESRDKVRNVEVQMELNLFRDVKYNKKNRDDKRKPE